MKTSSGCGFDCIRDWQTGVPTRPFREDFEGTPCLVRFPNSLALGSELGAQYPKNMGILLRTLPELSFGHALRAGDKNRLG